MEDLGEGPQYVYMQAADRIEADIRAGRWAFGSRLPGRRELAERYGVAELTVRRAMRELERRSVVRVLPSSGTWVTWEGSLDVRHPAIVEPSNLSI